LKSVFDSLYHGGLGFLAAVPWKWMAVGSPGVVVTDSPDGDTDATAYGQTVLDDGSVGGGLGGVTVAGDVQLGDGYINSQISETLQVGYEVGGNR